MTDHKYRYNPESLRFESISYTFWQRLIKSSPFLLAIALFSLLILFFSHHFIQSPKLKNLYTEHSGIELNLELMKGEIQRMEKKIADINFHDDYIYRTYFEIDPLPTVQREAGFGGMEGTYFFFASDYNDFLADIGWSLDVLVKKLVVQSKSFDDIIEMAKNKEKRLAARPAIQPVSIAELTRFGSAFGIRMHPILKVARMHEGIDLTCPRGTKVYATADGRVTSSGFSSGGLGIRIFMDHGFGYKTTYGHLEKTLVKRGDKVKRGDVIGLVGSTGLSLCPHLHYEVIANGKKVNPVNYYANDLTAEEYDKMIRLLSDADPGFDINIY